MPGRMFSFVGGRLGRWRVTRIEAVVAEGLPMADRVDVVDRRIETLPAGAAWILRGITSHERYVTAREHEQLAAAQPSLERPEATRAALIPIKKTEEWWQLSQDERRGIFEDRSAHIATGMKYLPAIARRLHHAYDLGEPFHFLTWFEYAPQDSNKFEELVAELRQTEEWRYVSREVDIRLDRG
ncbi:MAG TPA: chlorite dismutase family protein [Thermoanaerobaculia bacterium]|nr:chlorite dismutase family protein [Thermoanaerobaculia bacterium]